MNDAQTCGLLEETLSAKGVPAALDQLESALREKGDFWGWFYSRLMRSRVAMGACPTPTAGSADLTPEQQETYEQAIRDAAHMVGGAALEQGLLEQAWPFYKLLGDAQPVRNALIQFRAEDDGDWDTPIRLAFYEGLLPVEGYGWIIQRYGLCNAITALSQGEIPADPADRKACLRQLTRALHHELTSRLLADVARQEGREPRPEETEPMAPGRLPSLLDSHPDLTGEDVYHIDLSHLQSTVQLAGTMGPCPELDLACELCDYGARLKGRFAPRGETPFDPFFEGWRHYLEAIAGRNVDAHLDHFRRAAQAGAEEGNTYPSEVLHRLLETIGREGEALDAAVNCQSPQSLRERCHKAGDFSAMIRAAKLQGDPVHFVAACLEQERLGKPRS
jgi:hypothetical protein